ncbi:MAG: tRNA (N(6)-L-threonylcarbamoyladenosine(37)-C(2))-methylthiotransferase MtaB [Planctomycetota bacterium]|jgi:threonylcarbamoyladenosine tRNA methylthiotransferase MtaB
MKTYAIHTLGCKVNQYESQQIRQALEQSGLSAATAAHPADIIIVNTCCITHIASAKSRQNIRKAQRAQPNAAIIVTGCLPASETDELQNLSDIHIVKDKNTLPEFLDRLFGNLSPRLLTQPHSKPLNTGKIKDKNKPLTQINGPKNNNNAENDECSQIRPSDSGIAVSVFKELPASAAVLPALNRFAGQCRAFLKVQDGCDAWCTYCIIPKIRTKVCNKDVKSVLDESRQLIAAGHKEIVLTGIFLGAYGQTTAKRVKWDPEKVDSLAKLVNAVASLPGLERLRLSSLEPLDVTDRLLEVMTSHSNILPHFHLSLQSGSDNVLRKMARQYRMDQFTEVVDKLKTAYDRPALTTDIIVGFPGETEADFEQTVKMCKEVGFAKIHVFSFSPRKNTAAVKMAKIFGAVPPQEIKRRSTALQQVDNELQEKFRQLCSGMEENILVEKLRPPRGRCTRYFMVNLTNHPNAKNLKKGDTVNTIIES